MHIHRTLNVAARLRTLATGLVLVGLLVLHLGQIPASASHGSNEKLEIEAPHGGPITSSPVDHHIPFGGDWAMDVGAPVGTDVKVRWGRSTGSVTASVAHVGPACDSDEIAHGGHQVRVNFSVDGTYLGWIVYAHLVPTVRVGQPLNDGSKIGDIGTYTSSSCWDGEHSHIEPRQERHYSCFSRTSGGLSGGDVIGVLGGQVHSGVQQACTSEDFAGFPGSDTTKPTGSLDSPAAPTRWYPRARIPVSGVFNDNVKVTKVEFQRRVNTSGTWSSWSKFATDSHGGNGRYSATYVANHPEGTWIGFRAVAYDAAANTVAVSVGNNRITGSASDGLLAVGDLDGDGRADAVLGDPNATVDGLATAGRVLVHLGRADGYATVPDLAWPQGQLGGTEAGDSYGAAVAVGDFDGDRQLDVAAGAPNEGVDGAASTGRVTVQYAPLGSAPPAPVGLTQGAGPFASSGREDGDYTGGALAAGDFDGDGFDDLAIGAPGEGLGAEDDAGAVFVSYGSAEGFDPARATTLHQDVEGVLGSAQPADRFGAVLAVGDLDGDGYDDLAVSAPGEKGGADQVGDGSGAVHAFHGSAEGLTAVRNTQWHQNRELETTLSEPIPGGNEPDDLFGNALGIGDLDGDGFDDLVVGVQFESLGTIARAGLAHVLYGSATGITEVRNRVVHQDLADDSGSVADVAEVSDLFGLTVDVADLHRDGTADLVAGVINEDLTVANEGAVAIIRGAKGGVTLAGNRLHDLARFGSAVEETGQLGRSLGHGDVDGDGTLDIVALRGGAEGIRPVASRAAPVVTGSLALDTPEEVELGASVPFSASIAVAGSRGALLSRVAVLLQGPDGSALSARCSGARIVAPGDGFDCGGEISGLLRGGEYRYHLAWRNPAGAWMALTDQAVLTVASSGRLAGSSRYETAVAISQAQFPGGAATVYLARAFDPLVDAVAGGSLTDGPTLLVPECGEVPSTVTEEVARLRPGKVIALGGSDAICDEVLAALGRGVQTRRHAGPTRFETSVAISQAQFPDGASTVYLARAFDPLVDAVAAGSLTDGPTLLVPPCGEVPEGVSDEVARLDPNRVVALGETAAICDAVLAALGRGRQIDRLAGATRYETAVAISQAQFPSGATTVFLARALDPLVDAVAGGSLTTGPVLLVPPCGDLPTAVAKELARLQVGSVIALGGPAAICADTLETSKQASGL